MTESKVMGVWEGAQEFLCKILICICLVGCGCKVVSGVCVGCGASVGRWRGIIDLVSS